MFNVPLNELKAKIMEQKGLSEAEVEEKVKTKTKQLSGLISEEGAYHIVANELGVKLLPDPEERQVKDLMPGMRDVTQDLKVINLYELRTFKSKFGDGEGKVFSFLAGDESGVIRVTCWGERAEEANKLKANDIVKVKNAYVKENNGRAELHCNNKTSLVVNPPGVEIKLKDRNNEEYVRKKISELSRGDYRVELLGTVVQVYDPRFFDKDDKEGVVVNLLMDDGTGSVRCACWNEVVADMFKTTQEKLIANKAGSFEEEKTDLLGVIAKIKGRAKLNTVYNTIELNVDELDMSPSAKEELVKMQEASEKEATKEVVDDEPEEEPEPEEAEEDVEEKPAKKPTGEEVPDLDDLDDLADLDEL